MEPGSRFGSEIDLKRYEALLQMADLVVRHCEVEELFSELARRLRQLISCQFVAFCLHDPVHNLMRMHLAENHGCIVRELPVSETPGGWVWQHQIPLLIPDTHSENRFLQKMQLLVAAGVESYCAFPLTTAHRRLGSLGLGSYETHTCTESDLEFLQQAAKFVAVAVENTLTQSALKDEKTRLQMLLEVNAALVANLDLQEHFPVISGYMRQVIDHDFASIGLYEDSSQSLRKYALDFPSAPTLFRIGQTFSVNGSSSGQAFLERQAKIFHREQLAEFHSEVIEQLLAHGIQTVCCVPLITRKGAIGTLNLASKRSGAFGAQDLQVVKQIASQIAIALDNDRAYREIARFNTRLAQEKKYLQGEINGDLNFEQIIGESTSLKTVLEQTKTVAPSDASVLILGETGTGKELIARAIHRMSSRKEGSFIKLNCAAIPTGLLESELFGHEKGAFTGAVSQKIGRLELADKGTLFLDEVGEIPLELQPKLLRVLQDQEFERLGGTRTLKVNVRLIAATNRDLEKSVAEHQFRSDLYYRLKVFPIRVPPLRQRTKDIPLLVRGFVHKFARSMNKSIESIPTETMQALETWTWPGNIRELENLIERSVILTAGSTLNVPLGELQRPAMTESGRGSLEDIEREHIIRTLRETGGVIAGLHGAAARLGLKRTTLQSRMQRLGISRDAFEN